MDGPQGQDGGVAVAKDGGNRVLNLAVIAVTVSLILIGIGFGVWCFYGKGKNRHEAVQDFEFEEEELDESRVKLTEFAVMMEGDDTVEMEV